MGGVMTTYQFRKMERNQFDTKPLSNKTLYSYGLSRQRGTGMTVTSITYEDVMVLMDHFGVTEPEQLVNKTFETQNDRLDACEALDLLLLTIRHGGSYVPPTTEQIILRAVNSLATMTRPNFSDVDGKSVYDCFAVAFKGFKLDQEWFARFNNLVKTHSGGTVEIQNADIEEFEMRIRGPAAYFWLVRGNQKMKFVFGPYDTPFQFQS